MLKIVIKYIGYLMAFAGAVTVVWKVAVYFDRWDNKIVKIESKLETIIFTQASQVQQSDSILSNLEAVQEDVRGLRSGQSVLITSYSKHLVNDISVTKDDLLEFMRVFQYEQKKNYDTRAKLFADTVKHKIRMEKK